MDSGDRDWRHSGAVLDADSDPSLRDVYVLGTDQGDWETFLAFLPGSPWCWQLRVDNRPAALPADLATLWSELGPDQCRPLLCLDVAGVTLCCHFFSFDQIEFDLDSRELTNAETLAGILGFMAAIGRLLGRTVILTPESCPERPYFRYDPAQDACVYEDLQAPV